MARTRSFDPERRWTCLRVDVFWRKGFQGTSLDDITGRDWPCQAKPLCRFGRQNALFLQVLDRYHQRMSRTPTRPSRKGRGA